MINQKIEREAKMLFSSRKEGEDIFERLDEYSNRFKETMKA